MSDDNVFWQVCSTDRKDAKPFYEGQGINGLTDALRDLIAWEEEHTPDGYQPSGNVALYWHRPVSPADTTPEGGETE